MAWPVNPTTPAVKPTPETFFKPVSTEALKPIALKILVSGKSEVGKTYFSQTFPEPIYIVDTELGATKIAQRHFAGKKIHIAEVLALDPTSDKPNPVSSLDLAEKALLSLASLSEPNGTIVIDSLTDIWLWIQAWLDVVAERKTAAGQPQRFEWSHAQQRFRNLIMRLILKPQHLVMTTQLQPKYDTRGQELGLEVPHTYRQTPHWVDFQLLIAKSYNAPIKKYQYIGTLEKCRFQRAYNKEIEDITFTKLADVLEKDLKLPVRRT